MELLSVFAFAVALSMDGFGAGIVYGMRKIKTPLASLFVIGFSSSTAIGISMIFGHLVSQYISVRIAEITGALILIVMGLRILMQASSVNKEEKGGESKRQEDLRKELCEEKTQTAILNFKIKSLGLVIQILREPTIADIDKSGHISIKEALLLSLALAMDAMVAGFGAAMAGYRPLITPFVVGPVSALCVSLGVYIGRNYAAKRLGDKAAALPGWVLIFLGIVRVIKI